MHPYPSRHPAHSTPLTLKVEAQVLVHDDAPRQVVDVLALLRRQRLELLLLPLEGAAQLRLARAGLLQLVECWVGSFGLGCVYVCLSTTECPAFG
jgi:hypothetical protein